jgi:hypothetical protein
MSNTKQQFVTVVVLNDGETFTDVRGCSLCVIPLEQYESVVNGGGDAKDFEPIVEIGLDSIAN